MRNLIRNKSFMLLMFVTIFFGDYALSQNVLKSIIPNTQIITSNGFVQNKILRKISVENSIWPKVRISNIGLIDKLYGGVISTSSNSKNKQRFRIYIMGSTVPIFKSVVPQTRPL